MQIGWDNSVASDCAYVAVYMAPVDNEEQDYTIKC